MRRSGELSCQDPGDPLSWLRLQIPAVLSGKKVDYQGYDRLFYLAKINEKPEILLPMAMGRLLWPWELGSLAEEEVIWNM